MRTIVISIFCISVCTITQTNVIKTIKKKASSVAEKASIGIQSATKKVHNEFNVFSNKANEYFDVLVQNTKNIFTKEPAPVFCAANATITYAPTVDDPEVIKADTENMIPTIKKYAPVLYLCHERYYPIAAEDYFLAPTTQRVYNQTVIYPRGQIAMEKIYENSNII